MEPMERLLNLLILLRNAPRPLTFDDIREAIGAYEHDDRESAKRQFERDKDVLRAIGIPLELEDIDIWGGEQGYVIPPGAYELPEITFTEGEVAALFVAAHATGPDPDAAQAFGKLAQGPDAADLLGLARGGPSVGIDLAVPRLPAAADAARRGRRVRFTYRASNGDRQEREVDVWGLMFSRGSWYLVGWDRAREDERTFRLSRVLSEIQDAGEAIPPPEGFRLRERFEAGPWGGGEPEVTARVLLSPKVAPWALSQASGAAVIEVRSDGWTEADVPVSRGDTFVSWVLSFGPDAEVVSPAELRRSVLERLEAVRASL